MRTEMEAIYLQKAEISDLPVIDYRATIVRGMPRANARCALEYPAFLRHGGSLFVEEEADKDWIRIKKGEKHNEYVWNSSRL